MQTWKNCTADILYYDDRAATTNDEGYIVRLLDDSIEVAYDDDEGAVCYRGKNNKDGRFDNGHFELTAPERKGRASLHCFPNSHFTTPCPTYALLIYEKVTTSFLALGKVSHPSGGRMIYRPIAMFIAITK